MDNSEFDFLTLIAFDYYWKHCYDINDDYGDRFFRWIDLTITSCGALSSETRTYIHETMGECVFEISDDMHDVDKKWFELSEKIQSLQ